MAEALTVGAVTKTGELAEFSSRGPRVGDAGIKPDITAPGVGIVAARSSTSDLWPDDENPQYASLSGTSMATPHVAGAAAILTQQHPDWAPERIKSTLMAAAQPNAAIGVYEQGAGFLNVARAIRQDVTASPVSIAFERNTTAQQRTVTYANGGSSDLTLAVSLDAKDADGAPAPAGLFSLSASSVTVPAGGTATVTVNVQAGADLPDRYFGGEVTATGGGEQVQTPVALDVVRHDLAVKLIGPDGGAPTAEQGWVTVLTDLDRQTVLVFADPAATRYRVRAGRYLVQTYLVTGDWENPHITTLVRPSLDMTKDQALTMDTRLAKPIAVSVPNSKAAAVWQESGWTIRTEQPQIWGSNDPYAVLMNIPFDHVRTAQIGTGKTPGFVSYVNAIWAGVAEDGTLYNTPYVYRVYLYEPEKMMTGLTRKLHAGDFATVRSQISADVAGVPVSRTAVAHAPGNSPVYRDERNAQPSFSYDAPNTITEYYNQDKQAVWQSTSFQRRYTYYDSEWTSFQAGRTYNVKWANGVIGPVFSEPNFGQQWATRYWGDTIGGPGPLHGDGTGHRGFRFTRGGSVDVSLYRNGVKVGDGTETPWIWQVPAETGDYRLAATFRSDPVFTLSTEVDAEWTFKSGHVADGELVKLPLTAVRFTPEPRHRQPGAGRPALRDPGLARPSGRGGAGPDHELDRRGVLRRRQDLAAADRAAVRREGGRLGAQPGRRRLRLAAGRCDGHQRQHGQADHHPRLPVLRKGPGRGAHRRRVRVTGARAAGRGSAGPSASPSRRGSARASLHARPARAGSPLAEWKSPMETSTSAVWWGARAPRKVSIACCQIAIACGRSSIIEYVCASQAWVVPIPCRSPRASNCRRASTNMPSAAACRPSQPCARAMASRALVAPRTLPSARNSARASSACQIASW